MLLFPLHVFAHGGVEKQAGNILVTLFQTPLSPLVGEDVAFSFTLTTPDKNKRLVHKQARLVVTQTAYNNPSKDKIVYSKEVSSDVNGIINFSYAFPTTDYYDIDVQFGKPDDEANTTGFLVQPRQNLKFQDEMLIALLSISLIVNIVIFFNWYVEKKMKK